MSKMRLEKMLSNMGYGSRKDMKTIIKKGRVRVNGIVAKSGSDSVDTDKDIVEFDGVEVTYKEYIYLMLNKPAGVVSATEDNMHETVLDLLLDEDLIFQPFPVGRLDKDTEGMLILTNDGKFSHDLLSPKKHIPKTYYVEVDGEITDDDIKAFRQGINVNDEYVTMESKLTIDEKNPCAGFVTIMEGKFHQIKRMFIERDKNVTYLKRLQMGDLELDETIELGQYRELTDEEVEILKNSKRGIEF